MRPAAAESLETGWVIGALVPFLGLILASLFGPDAIRSWIADQLDVSRRSFQDLREWRERRFRGIPTLHLDDIRERITAPGATYETFDLLDAAADTEHWNAAALLPQREWLMVEIQRQTRIHVAYKEAERKAERREGQVQLWLAALDVYIVLVTFLA